jgi:YYY domain-containing protein
MEQALLALRWYVVVQIFGLAALPLALRLFRWLPDRGYGVSKAFGLLMAGWVFWLLASLGWLRNTTGGILVALSLVAAAGTAVQLARRDGREGNKLNWRVVVSVEALFAVTFASWCVVRAHMPRIETAGGEKWMEIAFLRAILRSEIFPPNDPWLSGFAISYYYFGYVIVAMIVRLSSVPPSIGFNLGIATLFALTCSGAFGVVYGLVAARKQDGEAAPESPDAWSWRAFAGGLLAPLLVAVMGNLEGLLEVLHARGIGLAGLWRWLDVRNINVEPVAFADGQWLPQRFYWWWRASRVLHDYTPSGGEQEVIDEFPGFSFLLGDMHPHVLALPFVMLALALALNLYRRASQEPDAWTIQVFGRHVPIPLTPWELGAYAICVGALGFLNTWDLPTFLLVIAAAYSIAHLHELRAGSRIRRPVARFAVLFVILLVLGLVLYAPFWISFQSQAGGILPNLYNGTRFPQFLVMFGPLFFVACAFVVSQAQSTGVRGRDVLDWSLTVVSMIVIVVVLALTIVILLARWGVLDAEGPIQHLSSWLRGEPVQGLGVGSQAVLHLLRNRFLLDADVFNPPDGELTLPIVLRAVIASPAWTALSLIVLGVAAALVIGRVVRVGRDAERGEMASTGDVRGFTFLLVLVGALLTLGVEHVYLRDNFGTRMNTVFKFYFQAWVLWAIVAAYALAVLAGRTTRRVIVVAFAGVLMLAGLVYPALAIPRRAGEQGYLSTRERPGTPATLDGAEYLAGTRAADYAAIEWLNQNVQGSPVILEVPGKSYDYEGRVSAHTGLPAVLGWSLHEAQWRGNYDEQSRREPDIERIYSTMNVDEALALLEEYQVCFVYVGPVERARYPAPALAKFSGVMDIVYDSGEVVVYQR